MRKEIDVTITDGTPETNRDFGKTFHLTEMPAWQVEKWSTKILFHLAQSGVEVPPGFLSGGLAAITVLGIQVIRFVKYSDAEPLLDEMMSCIQIKEAAVTRKLTPSDIEEAWTFSKLRGEVLELHNGFFPEGSPSK